MDREIMINGVINSVIFKNDDNGYAVIRLCTEDGGEVIAVGCVPFAGVGEYIEASGTWTMHESYGEQFKISEFRRSLPTSAELILEYLSSGIVKGIGRKTAEKIVERFGDESLYIISNKPKKLCEIAGITAKKAEQIGKQFELQNAMMLLMSFVLENELLPETAVALFHFYGRNACDAIEQNPYILSDPEIGVPFYKADKIAIGLGFEGDCRERLNAAVLYELKFNSESGHSFIPRDKLCAATAEFLSVSKDNIEETIDKLEASGEIVVEEICGLEACYLSSLYEAESYIAKKLSVMSLVKTDESFDCDALVRSAEDEGELKFGDLQKKAIEMAVGNNVFLLTGGPGTGKTTVIRGMLSAFGKLGLRVMLAAPTGRAAKRITEFCGVEAKTIHRMLELAYNENGTAASFVRDEKKPLETDVLIIDEMSMVDVQLMEATLRALPAGCKLVMVGDADQLPSVGAGNVFKDLLVTEKFPTVRLDKIFRQAQESDIIVGAHNVNRGIVPELKNRNKDLFFMQRASEEETVKTVLELCRTRLPENMKIPASQIQVLSASRKNTSGTVELNRRLQNELNPPQEGKDEKKIGDRIFRVGDRVMQIKNNYTLSWYSIFDSECGHGVFNGDIGEIISIDNVDELVCVNFDNRIVNYTFSMLNELELSYAMTIHKSQGSEFRAVVLVAAETAPSLLHRSVLYTAMTRARELLVIVGDYGIVKYMVSNNKQRNRYSALKTRILTLLG